MKPDTDMPPESQDQTNDEQAASPSLIIPADKPNRRKKMFWAGIGVCVVAVGILGWILLRQQQGSQAPADSSKIQQKDSGAAQRYSPNIPEYAKIERTQGYPHSQDIVALTYKGEIMLERTAADWSNAHVASWGDWLFFDSYDKSKNPEDEQGLQLHPTRHDVHALNLKTGQYVDVGEITALRVPAFFEVSDLLDDGYIYFSLGAYRSGTRIYRCQLDAERACTGLSEFYTSDDDNLSMSLRYRAGQYFVIGSFWDAGVYAGAAYAYDPSTKRETGIVETSGHLTDGDYVITIDGSGLVWVGEEKADPADEEYGRLVRLYALDKTGKVKKTVNLQDNPITGAIGAYYLSENEIQLYSYDKKVTYNTLTGQFGRAEDYDFKAEREASRDYSGPQLSDIQEKFTLPDGYDLVMFSAEPTE